MSSLPTIETLIAELKAGIAVLQELHTLAQTQSLFLESGDLTGLGNMVEAKERLVNRLQETNSAFSHALSVAEFQKLETPEVKGLKERAVFLLQRIAEVEARNRIRLQELKTDAVERSQKLQESRKISETYGR
jgi:hypothetical protein